MARKIPATLARAADRRIAGFPLKVSSPVQGFDIALSGPDDARQWIEREIAYWRSSNFATSRDQGETPLSTVYVARLEAMKVDAASDLQQYFEEAGRLQLVVGQSRFGEAVLEVKHSDPSGAAALVVALTRALQNDISVIGIDFARAIRASLLVSPAMLASQGLDSIATLEKQAKATVDDVANVHSVLTRDVQNIRGKFSEDHAVYAKWMEERGAYLTGFIAETEADLTRIRDLYHKHIQTEAAATYWNNRAKGAWWAGVGSLTAFIILVLAPLILGYMNLIPLKEFVLEISATSQGQLSITPIVAITVPVLAYAWILRHISRLFIQSFTQSDDARYRNVMTMTFLGLTKDKTSGVTEAERGIIMNALFRPTPPNTAEDGPPSGLIDLIKGSKT